MQKVLRLFLFIIFLELKSTFTCRKPQAVVSSRSDVPDSRRSFVILGTDTNNYFGFGNKLIFSSGSSSYRFHSFIPINMTLPFHFLVFNL